MSQKAWMRAAREICGITQADLADEADVDVRTVKRWENPNYGEPPADVLAWLQLALDNHVEDVNSEVAEITSKSAPGSNIVLNYYRDQRQRDLEGGVDSSYTYDNAVIRSVAERLNALGYRVTFKFPDQEIVGREI